MLNDIVLGKYYNTPSSIHNLNALSKLIGMILYIILLFMVNNLYLMFLLLVVLLFQMVLSNVEMRYYFKQLSAIKFFLIFLVLINIVFKVTPTNILIMVMQVVLTLLYSTMVLFCTKQKDVTNALEKLFSPLKAIGLPVSNLAMIISLALFFIPTIIEQSSRVLKALAARGVNYYGGSLKSKIKALNILLVPLFVLSLKRADQISDAMELRHYSSKRSHYDYKKMNIIDYGYIMIIMSLFFIERMYF